MQTPEAPIDRIAVAASVWPIEWISDYLGSAADKQRRGRWAEIVLGVED